MGKNEKKELLTNSNLLDKTGTLKPFLNIKKINNTTYYKRNKKAIVNRAKDYYENYTERLRKQARDNYRTLSEDDKERLIFLYIFVFF